jgi:serine/threonine-protein kinase
MTQTSSMMGSPLYMAPEQMTSAKHVDARADIWAVGIIMHELLTARVPFGGDTVPELCAKILTETPPPLRQARPEAPIGLERVIQKCLAKDRESRYANVAALAADLRPYAPARAHHSIERVSRVLGVTAAPVTTPEPAVDEFDPDQSVKGLTQGAWGQTQNGTKRRSSFGTALVAVAVLVAGGAAAALFLLRSQDSQSDSQVAASTASSGLVAVDSPLKAEPSAQPSEAPTPAEAPAPAVTGPAAPQEATPTPTPVAPTKPATTAKPTTTKPSTTTKKPATTAKPTTAKPAVTSAPTTTPAKRPVDLYSDRK